MATSIEKIHRSIRNVNINGNEKMFIIEYNENNIVTNVSIIAHINNISSFSKFDIFKNIPICDINDDMLKFIKDFDIAYQDVVYSITEAEARRKYEESCNCE